MWWKSSGRRKGWPFRELIPYARLRGIRYLCLRHQRRRIIKLIWLCVKVNEALRAIVMVISCLLPMEDRFPELQTSDFLKTTCQQMPLVKDKVAHILALAIRMKKMRCQFPYTVTVISYQLSFPHARSITRARALDFNFSEDCTAANVPCHGPCIACASTSDASKKMRCLFLQVQRICCLQRSIK